jgi:ABC-type phosphate transport system substrate-binding protein
MRTRTLRLVWAALVLSSVLAGAAPAEGFVVIVSPDVTQHDADRAFLSRAFLKKTTRWPDGRPIRPVDQAPDSAVRRRFAEEILGRSVIAVRTSWQQAIFSGRDVPPPELDSDAAVVGYVLGHAGAIGYVAPGTDVGTAHVLVVR